MVISDDDQIINHIACEPPIGNSDRCIIKLLITTENDGQKHSDDVIETSSVYNWHKADFNAIGSYLDCVDWNALVVYNPSALGMWDAFISILRHAMYLYVPTCNASSKAACVVGLRPTKCSLNKSVLVSVRKVRES